MKKPLIIIAILTLVIGIPVSKKYFSSENEKLVEVEALDKRLIRASILASGQLKHEDEVKLTSEVIGRVSKLFVKEGDKVVKGQVVLTIDDETYKAAVAQQQAAVDQQLVAIEKQKLIVENLTTQLNRKKALFNQKLLDNDAYELAEHQLQVSKVDLKANLEILKQVQARLDQAKDQLSKTRIVSPINGKITSLDIKEGETAISSTTNIAGSALMTIANPSSMLAEINVDEADIADVRVGQKSEIIAIAFDDKTIQGEVYSIASSAKQALGRQSLSFAVKLKITDANFNGLKPGMTCRAEVFTQGDSEVLAVPIKAIHTEEDIDSQQVENFVFVYENEKAHKRKVGTGISDDEYQAIINGLTDSAQIIIGPDKILRHLKDGEAVSLATLTNQSE
ncbi:efflux RND transporter periplasmic adaptor subunit [Aliikangiella sp. IMCC44632]